MLREIIINTNSREEFVDITSDIEDAFYKSGAEEGIVCVYTPHTTAGLTINENADPSVRKDILSFLNKKIPPSGSYRHLEGNSDAHIKSSLLGVSLFLVAEKGRLVLGRWQGVYFCEFDGPRRRKVFVKTIKG